jgi:hypothetical protein
MESQILEIPLVEQIMETYRVDIFQGYASQDTAIHILIWDPGGGVCDH